MNQKAYHKEREESVLNHVRAFAFQIVPHGRCECIFATRHGRKQKNKRHPRQQDGPMQYMLKKYMRHITGYDFLFRSLNALSKSKKA